jgi:hypothetical protein
MVKKESSESKKWLFEKRDLALKMLSTAKVLDEASTVFRRALEKNPDAELRTAVRDVEGVIEELRSDFKKNYVI